MAEKHLEQYLCRRVKALGGLAIKLDASTAVGIPDRLVVLPGRILFVELKDGANYKLSAAQILWKQRLEKLAAPWHLVRTRDDVENLIGRILGHEKQLR